MRQIWTSKIIKWLRWHRTAVAMLALFAALVAGLSALNPAGAGTPLVVAARDLPAGAVLTSADLLLVDAPPDLHPDGCYSQVDDLVGRPLSVGLTRGTPLTTAALSTSTLTDHALGEMLVPFRVHDAGIVALLRVGDRLTIVATTPEGIVMTVAQHVRVAQLPAASDGGAWGGSGMSGALIVVAAPSSVAELLAAASDHQLGVIIE